MVFQNYLINNYFNKGIHSFTMEYYKYYINVVYLSKKLSLIFDNDYKLMLGIKMPEVDKKSLDHNQKLIDFMNNGYKLSSPQNFINSVKN